MKEGDGLQRDREVATAAAMVAQDAPVLQTGDRVLDPGTAASMAFPGPIAADPCALKDRCDELRDAAIASVSEDATVRLAQCLEMRAPVVNRIVAIARPAGGGGDDAQIAATGEDLRVAGPAVILRASGTAVIAGWYQRAVDDPRLTPVA